MVGSEVWAEFRSILRFWLDRGVDGFRVDVAHGLVKDPALPDWDGAMNMVDGGLGDGGRPPMFDQDGVHEIYRDWRAAEADEKLVQMLYHQQYCGCVFSEYDRFKDTHTHLWPPPA